MRILRSPALISVLVLAPGCGGWGRLLDNYLSLSVLSMIAAYVVFAVGYNILMGVAGQFDFGQGAFLGIGAYAMAILESRYAIPFPLALPLAGLAAVLAGMAIGMIVLRLGGFYLALVTLGFKPGRGARDRASRIGDRRLPGNERCRSQTCPGSRRISCCSGSP